MENQSERLAVGVGFGDIGKGQISPERDAGGGQGFQVKVKLSKGLERRTVAFPNHKVGLVPELVWLMDRV